jgi:hypothetical protein
MTARFDLLTRDPAWDVRLLRRWGRIYSLGNLIALIVALPSAESDLRLVAYFSFSLFLGVALLLFANRRESRHRAWGVLTVVAVRLALDPIVWSLSGDYEEFISTVGGVAFYPCVFGVAIFAASNRVYKRYGAPLRASWLATLGGVLTLLAVAFAAVDFHSIDDPDSFVSVFEFLGEHLLLLSWILGLVLYALLALLYPWRKMPAGLPMLQSRLVRVLAWSFPFVLYRAIPVPEANMIFINYRLIILTGIVIAGLMAYGLLICLSVAISRIIEDLERPDEKQLQSLVQVFD